MARPKKSDTEAHRDVLTLRLTPEDRELLDLLVEARAKTLEHEGIAVTVSAVLRGLIRKEAASNGISARRSRKK